MATGQVICPRDSEGGLFIDRNPKCFVAIIDYLRNGLYREDDSVFLLLLHAEAKYFGISSLVSELEGPQLFSYSLSEYLQLANSMKDLLGLSIFDLTSEEVEALSEWCEAKNFFLLYRASRDGFESKNFHDKCDGITGTLTIIKTVSGYIFGGYSGAKWRSEEDPKLFFGTEHDFLFTLRNPQGTEPIQFPVRNDMVHKNSYCFAGYGPSFGYNDKTYCDMHVAERPNESNDSHVLGFPAMYDGKGYTNTIFCGSGRFQVEDYEVFLVINRWFDDVNSRLPIIDDPNGEHMPDVILH